MLDYAKKHEEVEHIIFDVTDRMTRNDMDKIRIWTLIKYHDKTIHFPRSNKKIDKTSGSEDEFMLDIEVAVAKKMSNDISRKTKMGMLEKAEQGLYPSVAPSGYKNNPITHLIEVDDERAPFIKRAFSLMATGSYSESMLTDLLYREGFRGNKGNRVGKSALDHILKNHIYYGVFIWNGKSYLGSHTPLISKDLFDRVQSVLKGNNRPYPNRKNFPFNNLITCGICNCKVLGEHKKGKYTYYHCTFSKGRHNGLDYIREEKLATMFEEPISRITIPEDIAEWMKEALRESNKDAEKVRENRLNSLKSYYDRANTRLSRLYDSKFDGEIEEDIFKAKEEEYKAQLIEIKTQIDNIKAVNPNMYEDASKTLELSKRLYSLYNQVTYEEKAKILHIVASNFVLNNKSLYPTYKRPFDMLAKGSFGTNWLPG